MEAHMLLNWRSWIDYVSSECWGPKPTSEEDVVQSMCYYLKDSEHGI